MLSIPLEEDEICSNNSRASLSRRLIDTDEAVKSDSTLLIGAAASSTSLVQGTETVQIYFYYFYLYVFFCVCMYFCSY